MLSTKKGPSKVQHFDVEAMLSKSCHGVDGNLMASHHVFLGLVLPKADLNRRKNTAPTAHGGSIAGFHGAHSRAREEETENCFNAPHLN